MPIGSYAIGSTEIGGSLGLQSDFGVISPIWVTDVYNQVCDSILEPGGLTGETLTLTSFYSFLNDALRDILEASLCFVKLNSYQAISSGTVYNHQPYINQTVQLLVDEVSIPRNSGHYWDMDNYRWPQGLAGNPEQWRDDELLEDQIEVKPAPSWFGYTPTWNTPAYGTLSTTTSPVTFDIYYEEFMRGTIGDTSQGSTYVEFESPMLGVVSTINESTLNITEISTYTPEIDIAALNLYIMDLPLSFQPYVRFGILARAHAMDGELKNEGLVKYYKARVQEIFSLLRTVTGEILLEVAN